MLTLYFWNEQTQLIKTQLLTIKTILEHEMKTKKDVFRTSFFRFRI
jgi:hypothetical protein